jgi:hypothetical protein
MRINIISILTLMLAIIFTEVPRAVPDENDWAGSFFKNAGNVSIPVPDSPSPTVIDSPTIGEDDELDPRRWTVYSNVEAAQWVENYYRSHSEEVDSEEGIEEVGSRENIGSMVEKNSILYYAKEFEGMPYGRGHGKVDCSLLVKFTLMKYSQANNLYETAYDFPNTSTEQYKAARSGRYRLSLIPVEQLRPGDLIFFANRKGKVTHVAFYVGTTNDGRLVVFHAAGKGHTVGYSAVPKSFVYACARFNTSSQSKDKTSSP